MREFSNPMTVAIPARGNLTDDVVRNAADCPQDVILQRREVGTDASWVPITAEEFHDEVRGVAKGLIAAGIEVGQRVAVVSKTRYEWTLFDYAIWFAGAVTVPVYETSSGPQIESILDDSGATAVVAEGAALMAKIAAVRPGLENLRHVWSITDNAVDILTRLGEDIADDVLEQRRTTTTPADLATLIYTSGTTGQPKGCMLSHGNFMFELGVAVHELDELFAAEGASTLLFLPLAHVFARIVQIGSIRSRTRLSHSNDMARLTHDLQELRPNFILAVPRVFEKVFNTASQRATADGRGKLFDRAAAAAIAYSQALDAKASGTRVPLRLRAQHTAFDRTVYARLRNAMGGNCTFAISGGAPMGERLGHFYRGIGLTVLEGYGLTETTAALCVNLPDAHKVGTVGRPLPGTSVRVADDGELMFRGGQVFLGYWRNDTATKEVLDDEGWFHTGDVGEVDDEGFVRITGRKKEILVTAGGKNVAPAALEDQVRAHPLVSQCLVVGEGQPFIAALITLDQESVEAWAKAAGRSVPRRPARDPQLLVAIQAAVDGANQTVSKAESIRKFAILESDWTEVGGHLTPSLKLKRAIVTREFKDEIAGLYLT